jgi:predicted DNA-binding protein
MMTGVNRSKRDKRGKLEVTSVGLYDDQLVHIEVLMRVTGKSKGRIIRESIDAYFANYRVGGFDSLGEAERRFREGQEADTGH